MLLERLLTNRIRALRFHKEKKAINSHLLRRQAQLAPGATLGNCSVSPYRASPPPRGGGQGRTELGVEVAAAAAALPAQQQINISEDMSER